MRRILVTYARSRHRLKRGGAQTKLTLEVVLARAATPDVDLMALDEALTTLAKLDAQHGRIVELRYFGGLTIEETAAVLDVSPATVKNKWSMARAWLHGELKRGGRHDA